MPRVNVDGAAAGHRMLSSGADPNRDHLLLSEPEIRALHLAMQALPPDVVFDHHEFAVGWPWLAKFGGLQAPDVMILEAINPSIPKAMTRIERELYRPALEAAIEAHGLMPHDYVTTGAVPADRRVWLGGTARRRAQHLRPARRRLLSDRDARHRHRAAGLPAPRGHALPSGESSAGNDGRGSGRSAAAAR